MNDVKRLKGIAMTIIEGMDVKELSVAIYLLRGVGNEDRIN